MGVEYAATIPLQVSAAVLSCAAWVGLRTKLRRDGDGDKVLSYAQGAFGAAALTGLVLISIWGFGASDIDLGVALWLALLMVLVGGVLIALFVVGMVLLLAGGARRYTRRGGGK